MPYKVNIALRRLNQKVDVQKEVKFSFEQKFSFFFLNKKIFLALSQKSSIEEVATKPIVKVSTSNGPPIQTSETINGNLPQEITVVETTARTSLPSNQNLDLFSVFVMAVLIALVLLNIFLLIQLCVLEGSSSSTDNSDNRIQLNDILVSSFRLVK